MSPGLVKKRKRTFFGSTLGFITNDYGLSERKISGIINDHLKAHPEIAQGNRTLLRRGNISHTRISGYLNGARPQDAAFFLRLWRDACGPKEQLLKDEWVLLEFSIVLDDILDLHVKHLQFYRDGGDRSPLREESVTKIKSAMKSLGMDPDEADAIIRDREKNI